MSGRLLPQPWGRRDLSRLRSPRCHTSQVLRLFGWDVLTCVIVSLNSRTLSPRGTGHRSWGISVASPLSPVCVLCVYTLCVYMYVSICFSGFRGSSVGKESACSPGDPGSIPGSGRSPGEGNDNSLRYSCLENPMDKRACWATVQKGHKKSHS